MKLLNSIIKYSNSFFAEPIIKSLNNFHHTEQIILTVISLDYLIIIFCQVKPEQQDEMDPGELPSPS